MPSTLSIERGQATEVFDVCDIVNVEYGMTRDMHHLIIDTVEMNRVGTERHTLLFSTIKERNRAQTIVEELQRKQDVTLHPMESSSMYIEME